MTFAAIETSPDSGNPIELYEFTIGNSSFRYTNIEASGGSIVFESETYHGENIERGRIKKTIIGADSNLQIELPGTNEFARLYIGVIPGALPRLSIKQFHLTDPDLQAINKFEGAISTVGFEDDLSRASLTCVPTASGVLQTMPRHTFQTLCNHPLFGVGCQVNEAPFTESVLVESISDRVVTIAAGQLSSEVQNYWGGGYFEFGSELRAIQYQPAGRVFTLDIPLIENPTGQLVSVRPGCDHIISGDCLTKYNNVVNHGGYPYMPEDNPFEGLD